MEKLIEIIKDMVKSLRFVLPVLFILIVIYAFYARFTKMDADKTVEDITYITNKVKEGRQEVFYKNFNNDTVVYSSFLPIDLKTIMTDNGYIIQNRFGSTMSFMEAYKTKEERDYYMSIKDNPNAYSYFYKGTGAYIITFPHIRRSACMHLAQTNWKKFAPNFFGIEVGRIDENNPKVGVERLNYGLLYGMTEIDYDGPDTSFVANRPLQYREAFKECRCLMHDKCVVSLKFL